MKQLPPALSAHLASGATTLAWCWRTTRRDGVRQGFTDHDRDIIFDATTFEAATGFTASELKDAVGLSVDNTEVESALSSAALSDADLSSGRYDDARVEIWRVNWADPSQRVLMRSGSIGQVRRSGHSFKAEIRGLAHYLQQPVGRLYQYTCDADLGDARCGVDLTAAANRASATVLAAIPDRTFSALGLAAYPGDTFARGIAAFTSGANAGRRMEIKRHALDTASGRATFELWQPLPYATAPGDAVTLTAGCDKSFATCRDRFANQLNFRGCPHIPGIDALTQVARAGDAANNGLPR